MLPTILLDVEKVPVRLISFKTESVEFQAATSPVAVAEPNAAPWYTVSSTVYVPVPLPIVN